MSQLSSLAERIIAASTTNYNALALIQLFKNNNQKNETACNILLLLLYSDLSYQHKNIIYSMCPETINFPSNIEFLGNANQELNVLDQNLLMLLETKCGVDNCQSFIDYYKETKDAAALNAITQNDTSVYDRNEKLEYNEDKILGDNYFDNDENENEDEANLEAKKQKDLEYSDRDGALIYDNQEYLQYPQQEVFDHDDLQRLFA